MPFIRQRAQAAPAKGLHLLIWLVVSLLLVTGWLLVFRWIDVLHLRTAADAAFLWLAAVASFLLLALALLASWTVAALRRHSDVQRRDLKKFNAIIRRAPGILFQYLWRHDGSSCFPFVSESIRDRYRLIPDKLAQDASSLFALIYPDDLAGVKASLQASARTMTHWGYEFRLRADNGTTCWYVSNAKPQRLSDGSVLWNGFMADVSAHKQTESTLITLSAAIEQSPVSIVISDLTGHIQYVNPMFERVTGYTRVEAIGKNTNFLASDESAGNDGGPMRQALLEGRIWIGEFHHRRKDGALFWAQSTISPIFDDRGVPIHYVAIHQDITEQKHTQAQLRIAAIAFESEEGLFITDPGGTILRVNPAFSRITLYLPEEIVGQKSSLLQSGRHDAAFYDAMHASLEQTGAWKGEIWNRRKNGEIYPVWLSISAVRDEQHRLTHYVAKLADITQRKADQSQRQYLAFYDSLTGLPNRRFLCDRLNLTLARIRRSRRSGALLLVDLDHFKVFNDVNGDDQGDLLLKQVAERLNDGVREVDTVARLEGDQFVLILQDLSSIPGEARNRAETVGEKLLTTLRQPYHFSQSTFDIRASLGVALFNESDDLVDALLNRATLARDLAKESGRNTLRFDG